jgi:hypothetical protein
MGHLVRRGHEFGRCSSSDRFYGAAGQHDVIDAALSIDAQHHESEHVEHQCTAAIAGHDSADSAAGHDTADSAAGYDTADDANDVTADHNDDFTGRGRGWFLTSLARGQRL